MFSSNRRAWARPSWWRRALRLLGRGLRLLVICLGALGPGAPPPPPPPPPKTEQRQESGDLDDD
jgi:hypothetical protein